MKGPHDLEDLFVVPHLRGEGLGRRLIEALKARAPSESWSRVYWHTNEDNAAARRLYDKVATLSPYIRYVVEYP